MTVKFDLKNPNISQEIWNYINSAENKKKEWSNIFSFLRENISQENWYKNKSLRKFMGDTFQVNPYIPNEIKKILTQRKSKTEYEKTIFLKQLSLNHPGNLSISEFDIIPNDFAEMLNAVPTVFRGFARNNLHDDTYFFSKSAEWFVSYYLCKKYNYKVIADIGAASSVFTTVFTKLITDFLAVYMIDLAFPAGISAASNRIYTVGANAGSLECIDDESVDYVCMHNAFEHFAGNNDIACLKEIQRILRPGGRAVIVPFFNNINYSILINPITAFFFERNLELELQLIDEFNNNNAKISFTNGFVSPYVRHYDPTQTQLRILETVKKMRVDFVKVDFHDSYHNEMVEKKELYGITMNSDIFQKTNFSYLEFVKL